MQISFSGEGGFFRWLTSAENAGGVFCALLVVFYMVIPSLVYVSNSNGEYYIQLLLICMVSVFFVMSGFFFRGFDMVFSGGRVLLKVRFSVFYKLIFSLFFIYVVLVWASAKNIPLVAALQGASPDSIAIMREEFLKAREGWQSSFVYINAIFSGAIVPYIIALMYIKK